MSKGNNDDLIYFNGINGSTGEYLFHDVKAEHVAKVAKGEKIDPDEFNQVTSRQGKKGISFATEGGDEVARDVSKAGWGLVISTKMEGLQEIMAALKPLLEHRKQQVENEELFKTLGYIPEKDRDPGRWLARYGASTGDVQPHIVPYYLLIVGSAEDIPLKFQFVLDVNYAVGRIHFDTVEEYASYAEQVVEREQTQAKQNKWLSVFGVKNPHDRATESSSKNLIPPLLERLGKSPTDWKISQLLREDATRNNLSDLLHSDDVPAFLFTASHGMGFDTDDPKQFSDQGALLCSDWPGSLKWRKPIPEDFYFSSRDIGEDVDLKGMMLFMFACYSGATPRLDNFQYAATKQVKENAPHDFISALPKRLLTAGASAIVAHVDRAWATSFLGQLNVDNTATLHSVIAEVANGLPIGYAMDHINDYYSAEESRMGMMRDSMQEDPFYKVDERELATTYIRKNDARNYLLLGDPAVRLVL